MTDSLLLDPYAALAEEATLGALLRCCIRELCGPRVRTAGPYLLASIAGTQVRVPARGGIALRFHGQGFHGQGFHGPAERFAGGVWEPLTSDMLIKLVERELAGGDGVLEVGVDAGFNPGLSGGSGAELNGDFTGDLNGAFNREFAAQVAASREAIAMLLAARERTTPPTDPWLASEQALVTGHPFHPSPKMRTGKGWERYAPEAHAHFPLRLLGVRADLVIGQGNASAFDVLAASDPVSSGRGQGSPDTLGALDGLGTAPPGYVLLPAHPWQLELLAADLRAPLADGKLVDLGYGSRPVFPTSSVRTVYEPVSGVCLKFSLDVRITNCVRKNAWYELTGAVELTRRLGPIFDQLAERFPGTRWLPEPAYRSAALGTRLLEGLGVIVRSGPWSVCGPGVTPILAAALAASPYGTAGTAAMTSTAAMGAARGLTPSGVPEAVEARRRADPIAWWRAYIERVAVPALDAFGRHGVVLESHLQNVLVGVDPDGLPVEAIFRDLEGTKLVDGRHDLSGLPERVAEAMTYAPDRGWNRVVYCLVVNHLVEIAATVAEAAAAESVITESRYAETGMAEVSEARRAFNAADRPLAVAAREDQLLRELWATAREVLARYAEEHGHRSARLKAALTALLSDTTLPAKANLGVRWRRHADRAASYVPVPNPLASTADRQ